MFKKLTLSYVFLSIGSLQAHDAAVAIDDAYVNRIIEKFSDEKIEQILERTQPYVKHFTNDTVIDRLSYPEKYRQLDQLEFNNHVIYKVDLPFGNPAITVALRNSDIGKGLFLLFDWWIELLLFQRIQSSWKTFASDYALRHKEEIAQAQTDEQLGKLVDNIPTKDIIGHIMRETSPALIAYLLVSHVSDKLKQHYLLDNTCSKNVITLLGANLLDENHGISSLFEFIEGNWTSGLPFQIIKTGVLDQINGRLLDWGLLPQWTTQDLYVFTKRLAFMALFMRHAIKYLLKPQLGGQNTSFATWLTVKSEKYTSWQAIVNVGIMVPAITVWAYGKYKIVKKLWTKNEGAA